MLSYTSEILLLNLVKKEVLFSLKVIGDGPSHLLSLMDIRVYEGHLVSIIGVLMYTY